jgi:phosphoribosylglycinamide formyltransferase-1
MSIVILISGRGSNMQAIIEAGLPVTAVISNKADAPGLALAAGRGIHTAVIQDKDYGTREGFDAALAAEVARHSPVAVALAGFMRILTPRFVSRYADRLVNIHPSLLPSFTGLKTHERALAAGVKVHGCTVHFVTPELDQGPIIAQASVPVWADDTPAALAQRVLRQEHVIYPQALRWLLEGALVVENAIVRVKDHNAQQTFFSDRP